MQYLRDSLPEPKFKSLIETFGGQAVQIPKDVAEPEDERHIREELASWGTLADEIEDFTWVLQRIAEGYGRNLEEIRAIYRETHLAARKA